MPRYFFHLTDSDDSVIDDEGVELSGREAAFSHAEWCVREIVANAVLEGRPIRLASYMAVHDSEGMYLGKLAFRDVVKFAPSGDGPAPD